MSTTTSSSCCASVPTVAADNSKQLDSFPVIDLAKFLTKSAGWEDECATVAQQLSTYGVLVLRDPRVDQKENDVFIDQMEQYYDQPRATKLVDIRPDVYYQVGATPDGIENARNHCARVEKLAASERPWTHCPPEADPKWRFFWRMGDAPKTTEFPQLNMPQVVPAAFPRWAEINNRWGSLILAALHTCAEMAACGFGLPAATFTDLMKFGPHLLAPTGGDLGHETYGKVGSVFANYHYDLNFMTIHGKSRFPGLFIWTRDGRRVAVRVPDGCLLIQAGKQFEYLTGGHVLAGFHEVVVSPDTVSAVQRARAAGRSLWRVSSTLFAHVASDNILRPLGKFATSDADRTYPATKAGDQVKDELAQIKLNRENTSRAVIGMGVAMAAGAVSTTATNLPPVAAAAAAAVTTSAPSPAA
jgi:isopenicillin N synthase-like dioxygenase